MAPHPTHAPGPPAARPAWRQEEAHLFGICNAAVHARQILLQPGQAGLRSLCVCAGRHPCMLCTHAEHSPAASSGAGSPACSLSSAASFATWQKHSPITYLTWRLAVAQKPRCRCRALENTLFHQRTSSSSTSITSLDASSKSSTTAWVTCKGVRTRPGAGTHRQGAGGRLLHFYLRRHFLRTLEGAVERVYPLLVLVGDLWAASLQSCRAPSVARLPPALSTCHVMSKPPFAWRVS